MSRAAGQGLLGPRDIAYIVTSTCLGMSAIWFFSALLCSPFGTNILLCLVPPFRPCNSSCGSWVLSVLHTLSWIVLITWMLSVHPISPGRLELMCNILPSFLLHVIFASQHAPCNKAFHWQKSNMFSNAPQDSALFSGQCMVSELRILWKPLSGWPPQIC